MTEEEWLVSAQPDEMLQFLRGRSSPRKFRLMACACCRRIWHLLTDDRSRTAVELGELYADGAVTFQEMSVAHSRAGVAVKQLLAAEMPLYEIYTASFGSNLPGTSEALSRWTHACRGRYGAMAAKSVARPTKKVTTLVEEMIQAKSFAVQAELGETPSNRISASHTKILKCIFGNPFRTIATAPTWLTPDVVGLASSIYGGPDFARMPELATALRVAGCADASVLGHCETPNEHIRGCWVVDLVLGKS